MRMKKWMMEVCVAALFLGSATLALASNEVRVTVDPLDWHWEGSITFETRLTAVTGRDKIVAPFSVGPGGGVQQVATGEVGNKGGWMKVWLDLSTVTNPRTGDSYKVPSHFAEINNPSIGNMSLTSDYPPDTPLTVFMDLNKLDGYYELKFFLSSADQNRCTTEGDEFSDRCFECVLNGTNLVCKRKTASAPYFSWITKYIRNCVGNSNGQMVHGLDAPDSCDNFLLENDTLHAQCRDSGGQYQNTSIALGEYFAGDPRSTPFILCAQ